MEDTLEVHKLRDCVFQELGGALRTPRTRVVPFRLRRGEAEAKEMLLLTGNYGLPR